MQVGQALPQSTFSSEAFRQRTAMLQHQIDSFNNCDDNLYIEAAQPSYILVDDQHIQHTDAAGVILSMPQHIQWSSQAVALW